MSVFVISVSQFLLAANWLLSRNFSSKWERIKSSPATWAIWGFFLIHVIGLLYSSDLEYGLDDLRKKLPFLLMPLFVSSEKPISKIELKWVLSIFTVGILISTGISHYQVALKSSAVGFDIRDAFVFVPHIRLGLLVDLAIVWLLTLLIEKSTKPAFRFISIAVISYLLFSLVKLQLITAIAILPFALLFGVLFSKNLSVRFRKVRNGVVIAIGLVLFGSLFMVYQVAKPFIEFKPAQMSELEVISPSNNMYLHQFENYMLENGRQVWIYIDDKAVRSIWNKKSKYDFDGVGVTGEPIRATLYRYMTSKKLRKDSNGMKALTMEDIKAVENGVTNVKYATGKPLSKRLYATVWELNNYFHNAGSNEGYSVARRLEFWKTGMQVISRSWLFGVGTGDVRISMNEQYLKNKTLLSKAAWYKPHNQFITTTLALGIVGLFVLILCFYMALKRQHITVLHITFVTILLMSFLTEDTIEGQVGASIFAGFYAIFFCKSSLEKDPQTPVERA